MKRQRKQEEKKGEAYWKNRFKFINKLYYILLIIFIIEGVSSIIIIYNMDKDLSERNDLLVFAVESLQYCIENKANTTYELFMDEYIHYRVDQLIKGEDSTQIKDIEVIR